MQTQPLFPSSSERPNGLSLRGPVTESGPDPATTVPGFESATPAPADNTLTSGKGGPAQAAAPALQAALHHWTDTDRQRNPGNDGPDREPRSLSQTTPRKPSLSLGVQVGPAGQESGPPSSSPAIDTAVQMRARVVAGPHNKLVRSSTAAPAETDLFERDPQGSGQSVRRMHGSTAAPVQATQMAPDSLFIGGIPTAADVRQGGIGDCYFLSVLLGIVNNDPARITSMMSLSGGHLTAHFHHLNKLTGSWEPVCISVNDHLLTSKQGGKLGLFGNGMRIADQPHSCAWWADLSADTLTVHQESEYEVALWAPLLEKGYADFAQRYGKYGQGLTKEEKKAGGGYKILDSGGAAQDCYPMFYGNAVSQQSTEQINFAPGTNLIQTNIAAIQRLVEFEQQGKHPGPNGGKQRFMQARISADGAIQRGGQLTLATLQQLSQEAAQDVTQDAIADAGNPPTPEVLAQRTLRDQQLQALSTELTTLQSTITAFQAAPGNVKPVVAAARQLQTPATHPTLWNPSGAAVYRQLRQNLGTLINLGSDAGNGRRTVYASHSYNIHSVDLCNASGLPLLLKAAEVPLRSNEISPTASSVCIENPHARNEPDELGTGPADGKNDGQFKMPLEEALRSFDLLRLATVEQPSEIGDFPTNNSTTPGAMWA